VSKVFIITAPPLMQPQEQRSVVQLKEFLVVISELCQVGFLTHFPFLNPAKKFPL
jgi:hypothetical protein